MKRYPDGKVPQYHGTPVPWVAQREGEMPRGEGMSVAWKEAFDPRTGKEVLVLDSPLLFRDDLGWLWHPYIEDLNARPLFAQLHPGRQRLCMDRLLCQVCSRRIKGRLTWLLPEHELSRKPLFTSHAPVCSDCVPVALASCPHVRRGGWVLVEPLEVRPMAVVGDVLHPLHEAERSVMVLPNDERAQRTLAKQRIVVLSDVTVVA